MPSSFFVSVYFMLYNIVLRISRLRFSFDFLLKKVLEMFGGDCFLPYLCIRFRKGSTFQEAFFERFRYKQASSTILT